MPIALDENRPDDRLKHTEDESRYLRLRGFRPVVSSNVSAVARDVEKLIVRFHGGATYVYPTSGNRFEDMMSAFSKGKFVWRELRKRNVAYYRVGNYNIPDDVDSRDMMQPMAQSKVSVDTIVSDKARANIVTVKQAQAQEVIIDIGRIPKVRVPQQIKVPPVLDIPEGIIAGLFLAQMINNAEEADNSRQA